MKFGILKSAVAATALVIGFGFSASSFATDVNLAINPETTVLYMKSNIKSGHITGFECFETAAKTTPTACSYSQEGMPTNDPTTVNILWGYEGDVYAANVGKNDGVQKSDPGALVGTVTGAPSFPMDKFGAFMSIPSAIGVAAALQTEALPWTCKSCDLHIGGSTFAKIPSMPLTGRAFLGLGNIGNPEGYLALKMAGCAAVQETSGKGDYANMMGTICLNGTIGFKPDFSGVGTSNCVMSLKAGPYTPIVE
jgi:hypothetical protein